MPAATFQLLAGHGSGHGKRHQMPGGEVQNLHGQGARRGLRGSLHLGMVESHGRLYQRIKTAALPPRPFVTIGTQTHHHYAGALPRQLLRVKTQTSHRTGAIPLNKNVASLHQRIQGRLAGTGSQIKVTRQFATAGVGYRFDVGQMRRVHQHHISTMGSQGAAAHRAGQDAG